MKEIDQLKSKSKDYSSTTKQIVMDLEIRSHMLIEDGINTFDDLDLQAIMDWILNDRKLKDSIHKFLDIKLIANWFLQSDYALELLADYSEDIIKEQNKKKGGK